MRLGNSGCVSVMRWWVAVAFSGSTTGVPALGAVRLAQGKPGEASPDEDASSRQSSRRWWKACTVTGARRKASPVAGKLAELNIPTLGQALVVPPFRASLVSRAGQP